MKNVHVAGGIASTPSGESVDCADDQATPVDRSDGQVVDTEARQMGVVASCSVDSVLPPSKLRRIRRGPEADQVMAAAYRCISCGYSAHSVAAMARHRLCHSRWSLPHHCLLCSHRATTRRLLAKHTKAHRRRSAGDEDSGQQHMCTYCPFKSSLLSDVAAHERFHGAAFNYNCCYCCYSVTSRRLLVQHRRLHANDLNTSRRLRCVHSDCPFVCYSSDQMWSHARQHADVGRRHPYACDQCSFAADCRNALSHHQRLHDRRKACQ